jgi:hypothetical protein
VKDLFTEKMQTLISSISVLVFAVVFPLVIAGVLEDFNIQDLFRKPVLSLFGVATIIGAVLTKGSAINLGFYNACQKEEMQKEFDNFNKEADKVEDYNVMQDKLNIYNEDTIKALQKKKYNKLKRKWSFKKFSLKIKWLKNVYDKKLIKLEELYIEEAIKVKYKPFLLPELISLSEEVKNKKQGRYNPKKSTFKNGVLTLLIINILLMIIATGGINGDIDWKYLLVIGVSYLVTTFINYSITYYTITKATLTDYKDDIKFKRTTLKSVNDIAIPKEPIIEEFKIEIKPEVST